MAEIEERLSPDGVPYRIHWAHWLPQRLGVAAITLGRDVYVSGRWASTQLIVEEEKHVDQWEALGPRLFPALYLLSYFFWRAMGYDHHTAYEKILFEREAKGKP